MLTRVQHLHVQMGYEFRFSVRTLFNCQVVSGLTVVEDILYTEGIYSIKWYFKIFFCTFVLAIP